MSDSTDAAAEINAIFARDTELYRVISQHGLKPVVWDITPEEEPALAAHIARVFRYPVTRVDIEAETEVKLREAEKHAPLLRALGYKR